MRVQILFKSGNVIEVDITKRPKQLSEFLVNGTIDLNLDNYTMIRWSEVEAIMPVK